MRLKVLLAIALAASPVSAAQLFSNGQVVTNPTGGTDGIAGYPVVQQQLVPGYAGLGFADRTANASITLGGTAQAFADDFTVPAGGWDLDTLTVYAFKSTSPAVVPPAATGPVARVRLNLWTDVPQSANGPAPLPSPLPTPVFATDLDLPVLSSTFVGYRTAYNTNANGTRPVYAYEVSLDGLPNLGQLAAGTYWLEWSFIDSTGSSTNILAHPVVRSTAHNFNARQFNVYATGQTEYAWFEMRDAFGQPNTPEGFAIALPFDLSGTVLPEPASLAVLSLAAPMLRQKRR